MTTALGIPSPAELAARTPADRDRALDVIRIVSLVGVVAGHTVMAISIIANHVLIWDNLLTTSPVFRALTWIFQIMPLFFFAGAAACLSSWRPGTNWGGWLMKRCTRLFRPVFYYLGFWAAALTVLYPVLPQHIYEPVAGVSIQLLWFLGAYVLVLAAMPALHRITTRGRLGAGVGVVYAGIAAVDAVRLHWPAASALGYLNLAVWLIPAMFGVAYRRGRRPACSPVRSCCWPVAAPASGSRWWPARRRCWPACCWSAGSFQRRSCSARRWPGYPPCRSHEPSPRPRSLPRQGLRRWRFHVAFGCVRARHPGRARWRSG